MIGGGRPLVPEILDQSERVGVKSPIFARSASAVTRVWKLSGQRCKAVIGLTIGAKMIGGDDPFYVKFWVKVTALEQNLNNKLR